MCWPTRATRFQPGNTLPSEQVHAVCLLEESQFLLEREQALVSDGILGELYCRWRTRLSLRMLCGHGRDGGWKDRTRVLIFFLRLIWQFCRIDRMI